MAASSTDSKINTLQVNPAFKRIDYPIRGPLAMRYEQLATELEQGVKMPFDKCIAHKGDLHGLKAQKPLTFVRQVLSLITYPELLMEDPRFAQDAKDRAKEILSHKEGYSIGSYTTSQGVPLFRQYIADYISQRDGFPCDPRNIYMTNGGSVAIQIVFQAMKTEEEGNQREGFFVAIPQYSLYQAIILELNSYFIPYYLDEDHDWQINTDELEDILLQAKAHCKPRVLVLTNPGNPTGHVLPRKNIEDVIKFCHRNKLVLFADEVYQENIYTEELPFYSCRQVMFEMGPEYHDLQLISMHCGAKGYYGEAAIRGGYFELHGFNDEARHCFLKKLTVSSCPNIHGQATLSLMCKPPKPGDESYELFTTEKNAILESLHKKAIMTHNILNQLPGMSCNKITGAMYAFPRIHLPAKAIEEAKRQGVHPDFMYAYQLLEQTGIMVINGDGFGQRPGTYHFRITTLPPMEEAISMFEKIKKFHVEFMEKYS